MALKKKPTPKQALSQFVVALDMGDGDAPPKEFPIFKRGICRTSKGIFNFTETSATKCMEAAAQYGNDFMVDYGHAAHQYYAPDPAEAGKAAAWFTPAVREGALWATNVRWTPGATKKLTDREYRYFSPVFSYSSDGEITELISVALTNLPATYDMEPLMASREMPPGPSPLSRPKSTPSKENAMELAQLIAMLSLNTAATEADVMAELARRGAQLAELSAITGQTAMAGVLGTVKAWKAASDSVASLTQRIVELEKKEKDVQLTALLDKAKTEGRVTPAMEPALRTMPVEQLQAFLSALPVTPLKTPAVEPGGPGGITVQLSKEEAFVASKMGVSAKRLAEAKAAGAVVFAEFSKKGNEDRT